MKSKTTATPAKPAPPIERIPLLYKITSVKGLLEISHATVYRMVATGELELVKLSTRASRITSASVARILEGRHKID